VRTTASWPGKLLDDNEGGPSHLSTLFVEGASDSDLHFHITALVV